MATPFLSIITINYNQAEGLRKTVASVVSQTYPHFEYLIIDGNSTDGSVEIIKEQEGKIDFWISEKDRGIYHAMNKGIEKAQGEYLLFLHSGDQFTSPTILAESTSHPKFKGDIIYGDYQFEEGVKVYPDELYPTYFMKTSLPHQSTFFKKPVFEWLGNYDESYTMGADRAFYIKAFLSNKVSFSHIPLFVALFDLSGMSNDPVFWERKKEEDQRLLRESYGNQYEYYRKQYETELQHQLEQRNTLKGILKRIKKRWRRWMP
ncbi:MAG: glycosyltransferase family 2 protein [Flavobacteriaceae bacterium]